MKKLLQLGILILAFKGYSQPGSLDASFGTGGKVVTSINSGADKAYAVAVQTDGKIVVAGFTYSAVYGNDFACVRYNTDGSLDTTFGTNGKMSYDLQSGSDDKAYAVAIQGDGKIVLAGYSDDGSDKAGAVIRITSTGSLDTNFANGGKAITNFTIYNATARADEYRTMKIHQVTGNIIVGGTSVLNTDESKGIFARYTPSGILDSSFGVNGRVIDLPFPESNANGYTFVIEDLAIKSNGKITAVGWSDVPGSGSLQYSRQYVCRLNSNGTLDTTFSTDGYSGNSFTTSDCKTYAVLLNADDSFLFAGSNRYSSTDYKNYYGSVSSSGTVSLQGTNDFSPNTIDMAYDIEYDSTGKILIAGSSINSTSNSATFALSRVNANYSIDTTFGTSGNVTTSFGSTTLDESFDMAVQADDKIILVGYTGNDFAIARYNSTTLSANEFVLSPQLSLYPNPTKMQLTVNLENSQTDKSDYKIIDINGRIVLSGTLLKGVTSIAVEHLAKGLYIFNLGTLNQKFVKE